MPIGINSRFTSKATKVLNWARTYSCSLGRSKINTHDILKALVMVPGSVASDVLHTIGLSEAIRTHFNLKPLDVQVQTLSDGDFEVEGYGSIVCAQTYADESGSDKINTGHLLLAAAVLCATVIPYSEGAEENQKQNVRGICRLVRDMTPRHEEIAETDDLQTPVLPPAQPSMVFPPKPQREDEPIKLQPVERVVPPDAFAGLILDLSCKYLMGFETSDLRTLFVAALESYDPRALNLSMGQMISVVRLLGWRRAGEFTNHIRRLAEPSVSVAMVQGRYDEVGVGSESSEERELFGILLQLLTGQSVRRRGPAIDWLKTDKQGQKPEGGLPEWP